MIRQPVASAVLLLWVLLVGGQLHATDVSADFIESLVPCERGSAMLVKLQAVLNTSFRRVQREQKIISWEMEDRLSRTPHYCIGQCSCLAGEYVIDFKKAFAPDQMGVQRVRLSGGPGILPVEINGRDRVASFRFHVALLFHDIESDCAVFIDPIAVGGPDRNQPLAPKDWASKIRSLRMNSVTLFTL